MGFVRSALLGCSFYAASGCCECCGSGFRGRLAIHEVLLPDDDFRTGVMQRLSTKDLRQAARRTREFLTLQEAGLLQAAEGQTTLGEIVANAPQDTSARPLATLRTIAMLGKGVR
jgi:type IV pilus assembly protein PilB